MFLLANVPRTLAAQGFNRRALLLYNENRDIDVMADRRIILDGRQGAEQVVLTLKLWKYVSVLLLRACVRATLL